MLVVHIEVKSHRRNSRHIKKEVQKPMESMATEEFLNGNLLSGIVYFSDVFNIILTRPGHLIYMQTAVRANAAAAAAAAEEHDGLSVLASQLPGFATTANRDSASSLRRPNAFGSANAGLDFCTQGASRWVQGDSVLVVWG